MVHAPPFVFMIKGGCLDTRLLLYWPFAASHCFIIAISLS